MTLPVRTETERLFWVACSLVGDETASTIGNRWFLWKIVTVHHVVEGCRHFAWFTVTTIYSTGWAEQHTREASTVSSARESSEVESESLTPAVALSDEYIVWPI